jgi:hypothetical protein
MAGGRGRGPARVTTRPTVRKNKSPPAGTHILLRSVCHTVRPEPAGTCAHESLLPHRVLLKQRTPAAPPSTKLTHSCKQTKVMVNPWFERGALVLVVGGPNRSSLRWLQASLGRTADSEATRHGLWPATKRRTFLQESRKCHRNCDCVLKRARLRGRFLPLRPLRNQSTVTLLSLLCGTRRSKVNEQT